MVVLTTIVVTQRPNAPTQPDLSTLAGRLQWIIGERGFGSARKLSQEAGVAEPYVAMLKSGIRGKKKLSDEIAEKIARAGRVPVAWLKTGVGDPNDAPSGAASPPGPEAYPRRRQAIEILVKLGAKDRDPVKEAVIAGLEHEKPPEDLSLRAWLQKADEIETDVRAYAAKRRPPPSAA